VKGHGAAVSGQGEACRALNMGGIRLTDGNGHLPAVSLFSGRVMATTAGSSPCAVVLANGLNGYGALRSLDAAGIATIAIVPGRDDLSAHSRLPRETIVLPVDEAWEEQILKLLFRLEVPSSTPLIACSDRAAAFLQASREVLEPRFGLLIPDGRVIETLNDKRTELELMQSIGVPIPGSVTRFSSAESLRIPLTMPLIVKPRTHEGYATLRAKNRIIATEGEWSSFLSEFEPQLDQFVVQEVIPGPDENLWVCNATLDRESRLVRFFSFQRLGTAPSHYGVTSLAVSTYNELLRERVQSIAVALAYVGPLMMEFKYDEHSGEYLYIETNPRLGMCNWFDTSCGVNNAEAVCRLASGGSLREPGSQLEGVVFVHALADLIARLESRERWRDLAILYGRLARMPKTWAVLTPADPAPFLKSLARGIAALGRRAFAYVSKSLRWRRVA